MSDARSWYEIRNAADKDEADVLIYNEIGAWGLNAYAFARQLKDVTAKTINVRLNSPGGSVFDGTAIYNALRSHDSKIVVHVDGIAASIASVIAMAGDEIRMAKNAYMMIHNPAGAAFGGAEDMRKLADLLDKIAGTIAQTYADRSDGKKTRKEFAALMDAETWFTAKEAKAAGLVDTIYDRDGDSVRASANLAVFNSIPSGALNHVTPDGPPAASRQVTDRDFAELESFISSAAGRSDGGDPNPTAERPKEQSMSQPATTPTAVADQPTAVNEPKPATIAELKAAFADDPAFALEAAEKAYTLTEAKAAYADVLAAELKAVKAAADKPAEQPAAPVGNKPLGNAPAAKGDTGEPVAFGTAKAEFNAEVRKLINSGEYDHAKAVRFVAKAQPELYNRMLDEANPSKK